MLIMIIVMKFVFVFVNLIFTYEICIICIILHLTLYERIIGCGNFRIILTNIFTPLSVVLVSLIMFNLIITTLWLFMFLLILVIMVIMVIMNMIIVIVILLMILLIIVIIMIVVSKNPILRKITLNTKMMLRSKLKINLTKWTTITNGNHTVITTISGSITMPITTMSLININTTIIIITIISRIISKITITIIIFIITIITIITNINKNINNHKVVIMRLNMIKLTKTTLSGVKMLVKMIRKLPHPIILSYKVRCKIIQMIQIS
jgi:hypothetical protein